NLRHDSRYADVMERCLFNGVISGLSFDGQSYFYVNPLSVKPQFVDKNPSRQSVKYRRQAWYGCACCPPNIARIMASLGEYAYHLGDGALYADLFHDGTVAFTAGDKEAAFRQRTEYPWSGDVAFEFTAEGPVQLDLAVRIPAWCRKPAMTLNGTRIDLPRALEKGYAHIPRQWRRGDMVQLTLPMPVERVRSDPRVEASFGRVAVQKGPLVYCLEEADNGPFLHSAVLPPGASFTPVKGQGLPDDVVALKARGRAWDGKAPSSPLYALDGKAPATASRELVFIPYYAWANRQPGEMTVWVRE
ncbi:MAG TPA: beta-L-arabinofuranosidase domain-containing protein, partial [bacterium]|nr:beta-L-arabinofuranosidase domain-containing protein [bacterium]